MHHSNRSGRYSNFWPAYCFESSVIYFFHPSCFAVQINGRWQSAKCDSHVEMTTTIIFKFARQPAYLSSACCFTLVLLLLRALKLFLRRHLASHVLGRKGWVSFAQALICWMALHHSLSFFFAQSRVARCDKCKVSLVVLSSLKRPQCNATSNVSS